MAYASSSSSLTLTPRLSRDVSTVIPYHTTLKDGRKVVLDRALVDLTFTTPGCVPQRTLESMRQLLNLEIESGNTYPFEICMSMNEFVSYYAANDLFFLRITDASRAVSDDDGQHPELADASLVGCFYVKPNYPGRSSHICNAGFLVAPAYRGLGAGRVMGERYRLLGKALGYQGSMFNLVYETNTASNKLWRDLGFQLVGRVPRAGRLLLNTSTCDGEKAERFVDALQWYFDFSASISSSPATWEVNPRVEALHDME